MARVGDSRSARQLTTQVTTRVAQWMGALLLAACGAQAPAPASAESANSSTAVCQAAKVALLVLGSGGPVADDARASSAYLVFVGGKARLLVDAGGGTFQRFGASGARVEDLELVALSHLHVDHTAGLPPLLKSAYFSSRKRPLPIAGPSGNDRFLDTSQFIESLLDPETGSFGYLSPYVDGSHGFFKLVAKNVPHRSTEPAEILRHPEISVQAVGVRHGGVPALGFVATIESTSSSPFEPVRIGFGGDQSAGNQAFLKLAHNADLLILHHPIPENAINLEHLHARPSQLGTMAAEVAPSKLVLSHHMSRSLERLDEGLALIRKRYHGEIAVANDLSCYVLR